MRLWICVEENVGLRERLCFASDPLGIPKPRSSDDRFGNSNSMHIRVLEFVCADIDSCAGLCYTEGWEDVSEFRDCEVNCLKSHLTYESLFWTSSVRQTDRMFTR
jgi:hypothetical protein